jgi:hypothetical protein
MKYVSCLAVIRWLADVDVTFGTITAAAAGIILFSQSVTGDISNGS